MSQTVTWNVSAVEGQTLRIWDTDGTLLESQGGTPDDNRPTKHSAVFATDAVGSRECDLVRTSDSAVLWVGYVMLSGDGSTAVVSDAPYVTALPQLSVENCEESNAFRIKIGSLNSPTTDNTSTLSVSLSQEGVQQIAGSVNLTIYNLNEEELDGINWPLPLTHIGEGIWSVDIAGSLRWPPELQGKSIIKAVAGSSVRSMPVPVIFIQ